MDVKKKLAEFKTKVDPELENYFSRVIVESDKKDSNISDAIRYARDITMSGGKRVRAAFVYFGYMAAGGKNLQEILKASISIELIHSFLLIHDDIIDKDSIRHGVKTIHVRYSELAKKYFKNKDADHFGSSMAIIIGDMMGSFGGQALFESKFNSELVIKALHKMQEIVSATIMGQAQDIYIENKDETNEKEVLEMYKNKTAKYTLEGPLHLGATLAGADQSLLLVLSNYAIPTGIAFQIQDDILGIFGKIKKTGKSVGSDVRQGKKTLLVVRALEMATREQRSILNRCLGNKDLTEGELDEFKQIIIDTGALDYARKLAEDLIVQSKKEIAEANIELEAKNFLLEIAEYMLNREA